MRQRIAQQQLEQQHTDNTHHKHHQYIKQQFCNDEICRTRNGIKIQHAFPAFLQKTFGHRIYADKQFHHPEQSVPYSTFRLPHSQVQYEDGTYHIQQDSVKRILLPDLQQYILFEQGGYFVDGIHDEKSC